jgi:hypothetical protein
MIDFWVVSMRPTGDAGVKKWPPAKILAKPFSDVIPALKIFSVASVMWVASSPWA